MGRNKTVSATLCNVIQGERAFSIIISRGLLLKKDSYAVLNLWLKILKGWNDGIIAATKLTRYVFVGGVCPERLSPAVNEAKKTVAIYTVLLFSFFKDD